MLVLLILLSPLLVVQKLKSFRVRFVFLDLAVRSLSLLISLFEKQTFDVCLSHPKDIWARTIRYDTSHTQQLDNKDVDEHLHDDDDEEEVFTNNEHIVTHTNKFSTQTNKDVGEHFHDDDDDEEVFTNNQHIVVTLLVLSPSSVVSCH